MHACPMLRRFSVGRVLTVLCLTLMLSACESVTESPALEISARLQVGSDVGQEIILHDGDSTWSTRTDRTGAFRFVLPEHNHPEPDAFLWLTTRVALSDEREMDLEMLLGEFSDLQAQADNNGLLSPEQSIRVNFSALRAVETVMLEEKNFGLPVRSAGHLQTLRDQIDPVLLLDAATALYAGIHPDGPDLPSGTDSVQALLGNEVLISDLIRETGEGRPDILARARASALGSTEDRVGWQDASELATAYALFQPRYPAERGEYLRVDAGGSGSISAPEGSDDFQWRLENGVLVMDAAGDMTWSGLDLRQQPGGGLESFLYTEYYESLSMHLIAEGADADLVLVQARIRREYDDEDLDDQVRTPESAYTAWRGMQPSLPENGDGFWSLNLPRESNDQRALQVELFAGGMGEVVYGGWKAGETINWETNDGELGLVAGDNARLDIQFLTPYRVGWAGVIVERDTSGDVVSASVDMIGKGRVPFLAADVPGSYAMWGGRERPADDAAPYLLTLDDDGSGVDGRADNDGTPISWVVENDHLLMRSCLDPDAGDEDHAIWVGIDHEPGVDECDRYRRREWRLIDVIGDDHLVLEQFEFWQNNSVDEEPDGEEHRRVYFLSKSVDDESNGNGYKRSTPRASMSQPLVDRDRADIAR